MNKLERNIGRCIPSAMGRRGIRGLLLSRVLIIGFLVAACHVGWGAEARIVKVLPQLLDKQGRNSRLPGLLERDKYQAWLREHPEEVGGMQFAVYWRGGASKRGPVTMRLELLGLGESNKPVTIMVEQEVEPRRFLGMGTWSYFKISSEDYKKLGILAAWRVSLVSEKEVVAEHRSFLW